MVAKELRALAGDHGADEDPGMAGAEHCLMDPPARPRRASSGQRWAAPVATLLLVAGLAIAFLSRAPARPRASTSGHARFQGLAAGGGPGNGTAGGPCEGLPAVRLDAVLCNNLGEKGVGDQRQCPEGIDYNATANSASGYEGEGGLHHLRVGVHSIRDLLSSEAEGYDTDYAPAWTTGRLNNGIYGTHFGAVNLKAGRNVSLLLRLRDAATNESITVPEGAVTFFDLDAGAGSDHAVEFVRVPHPLTGYIVTNETEVNVTDDGDFLTFTATREGGGDDNPTDPLRLTSLQKNRAVTVLFGEKSELRFQVGSSGGERPRIFMFVLRPALACSYTMICPDGGDICDLDAAEQVEFDDPRSPVEIVTVKSGARAPSAMARGVLLLLMAAAFRAWP